MAATVGKPDRTPADPPPTFTRITQAFDDTKLEVETELPAAVIARLNLSERPRDSVAICHVRSQAKSPGSSFCLSSSCDDYY